MSQPIYKRHQEVIAYLMKEMTSYHAMIDPELMPSKATLVTMLAGEFESKDYEAIKCMIDTFMTLYVEKLLKTIASHESVIVAQAKRVITQLEEDAS